MAKNVLRWWVIACIYGCASSVLAQETGALEQQVQMARSLGEVERQTALMQGAQLSDAEATAFAPIYQDYRGRVAGVHRRIVALLDDYAAHYESLTDARAEALTGDWLAIERERIDLKTRYAKKLGKALSAVKVARVLQIENRIDLLQMIGTSAMVPLVKP